MTPLTPRQYATLHSYARHGSYKVVAHELGVTISTVKNQLNSAYEKLDVGSAIEAFYVMGWLRVPAHPGSGPFVLDVSVG